MRLNGTALAKDYFAHLGRSAKFCLLAQAVCEKARRAMTLGSPRMKNMLRRLLTDTEGQDLIEYALLAALIALAAITAMTNLGGAINAKFGNVSSSLLGS